MPLPFRFTAETIAPVVYAALAQFDAAYLNTVPKLTSAPKTATVMVPPLMPFAPPPRMPDESDDDYAARSSAMKEEYDQAVIGHQEAAKMAAATVPPVEDEPVYEAKSWHELEPDEQGAVIGDVQHVMDHPSGAGAGLHERWVAMKQALGWSVGTTYDPAAKQHPYGVSYGNLPDEQKARYNLMHSVVLAMSQSTVVQSG